MAEDRTCEFCPKSAGAEGVMPFGWNIAPVYLRLKGRKEHIRTIYECPDCAKKHGAISQDYIDNIEKGIRSAHVAKPKKRKK